LLRIPLLMRGLNPQKAVNVYAHVYEQVHGKEHENADVLSLKGHHL
jgi:hypothetical protein